MAWWEEAWAVVEEGPGRRDHLGGKQEREQGFETGSFPRACFHRWGASAGRDSWADLTVPSQGLEP